jgi:hypothetical protein
MQVRVPLPQWLPLQYWLRRIWDGKRWYWLFDSKVFRWRPRSSPYKEGT